MPATTQDYSQIKVNQDKAASLNREAAGMNATAFTLPDTIMKAVQEDRTARGVSKLATDTGNVMGQMVSDPNAIRGVQEQGLMDPFSVNALTSNARKQNLSTLGTVSTQLEQNQGSLDEVIQAGANQLKARASTLLAQAQQASEQATALEQEYQRAFQEKQFNADQQYKQAQLALDQYKAYNSGGSDTGVYDYIDAVLSGGDLSTVPLKYRSIVDAATKQMRASMSMEDQIKTLPKTQQTAAIQALDVYKAVQNAKVTAGYSIDPNTGKGKISTSTGPIANAKSQVSTNWLGAPSDKTFELNKSLSEITRVLRLQGTGVAFSPKELEDYINEVGSAGRQEGTVASGLDYVENAMLRKLSNYGISRYTAEEVK
jgi:exonuclease VII small subunit